MVYKLNMALSLVIMHLILFLVSPVISGYSLSEIKSWCSHVSDPESCNSHLTQKSDSLRASIRLALDHALTARANTYALGSKCRNEGEKAAWADCVEFHDSIVIKLNQTLDPTTKPTPDDVQTWLSCSLTNLETCREGFIDLGIIDNVMPLIFNNDLRVLISNCLALNRGYYDVEASYKDGFPTWVSVGDRKLLQSSVLALKANIVVAQDGSGNCKTVKTAVALASRRRRNERFVIYVKAGTYAENVVINSRNVTLVGDGIGKTIITGNRSVGGSITTFNSCTVAVNGLGFTARGITFRNTAGPHKYQAVAFRSSSDQSVFYQCSFEGYQDTLYVHCDRQFYRECDIYGTVDVIFGNAAVVFQNCNIYARNPPDMINTLTAQGRTNLSQTTGISIHNCSVKAAPDLTPHLSSVKTYLGRPWKEFSTCVFMKTFLDNIIDPDGWKSWNGDFALDSLYYGEYKNTGPGSSTGKRVKWPGYHVITSAKAASNFTVRKFFSGDSWLPDTNVPYDSGL